MTGKNKQPLLPIRHNRLVAFVGSRLFFRLTLALFIVQASWIAFSNKFPLAFDEGYHFGIIKLYSHQFSPFFASEPQGAHAFGDVTRDPSYLFHYLMSFPYRVFHVLVPSFAANIIFLRLLDVALFAIGVVVFRKVLIRTGLSHSLAHLLLLGFMLLPVVPFLAANINYDNLLVPLTGLAVLLSLQVTEQLRSGELRLVPVVWLTAVCAAASLTKYTFLPIVLGISLFLAALAVWQALHGRLQVRAAAANKCVTGLAVAALVVFGGMSVERYGVNLVRYHTPAPQCNQVLSIADCQAYGVWVRNHTLAESHTPSAVSVHGFLHFDKIWLGMMADSTFAVISADNGGLVEQTTPLLKFGVITLAIFGAVAMLFQLRHLRQLALPLALFMAIGGCYCITLLLHNYGDFNRFGLPLAVQGRYLLPVLPLLAVVPFVGIATALRNRPQLNASLATFAVALSLFGGGVNAYLLKSNSSWYWSDTTVASINVSLHDFLQRVIPWQ